MIFDLNYLLIVAPAILLALWAQMMVKSAYAQAQRQPAALSGAAAARYVLDSAGLQSIDIEMTPGHLSDHYDPRHKVLRLSQEVYQSRSLAAVGIAAHEAGHAIQDARHYAPLVIRNMAVPAAGFGSGVGWFLAVLGLIFTYQPLLLAGILLFSAVVFFQVVNLPVEFNASSRAKEQLATLGIVGPNEMPYVRKVLNAAALTYVAATFQVILQLLYLIMAYNRR
jgi:hypothetical protein